MVCVCPVGFDKLLRYLLLLPLLGLNVLLLCTELQRVLLL
jgi:hypothetical protein